MPTVAWLGTGAMGRPMVDRLTGAGLRVTTPPPGRHRDREAIAAALAGAEVAVTCLPGPADVRERWCEDGGVLDALPPGGLAIDMSTVGVEVAVDLARAAGARGLAALDCPVSGGPGGAAAGTLSIMAGGAPEDVERARPLLEILGTVHQCGSAGSGQAMKLVNQSVLAGTLSGLALGFALCERTGVDPALAHRVLAGGVVRGFLLDALWPRMATGQLDGGFALAHMRKDVLLAGDEAAAAGLPGDLLDVAARWLAAAIDEAGPDAGTHALVRGLLT